MPTLEKEELQRHVKHTGGIRIPPPPPPYVNLYKDKQGACNYLQGKLNNTQGTS